MPGGRNGIACASASSWRSCHRRRRRRHRRRRRRRCRRQEMVTHQWVPREPVQAVYWRRSWAGCKPRAMSHFGLATGAHEVATAWCDETSLVASGLCASSPLIVAEEQRMDSHPENAACSARRAAQ